MRILETHWEQLDQKIHPPFELVMTLFGEKMFMV